MGDKQRDHKQRAKDHATKRKGLLKKAFTTGKIAQAVKHAVGLAEAVHGPKTGKVKHRMVVGILNTLVDIPALNEATEAWVFDHAIGYALKGIKAAADALKKADPKKE